MRLTVISEKCIYQPLTQNLNNQRWKKGSAFIPYIGHALDDILCEKYERVVGNDNCVAFEGRTHQIPQDQGRHHYVKVEVRVHRYGNGNLAGFHGPRKLAVYDSNGNLIIPKKKDAA